jgi:gamma-glutamyltranspeptidase/glutathione hydrolase
MKTTINKTVCLFNIILIFNIGHAYQKSARSQNGMVVAPTPEAAEAGLAMLRQGGNAMDAAAATAFVLMVTDPAMCSLAGRSQILIRLKDGTFIGIDGATQTPLRVDQPAKIGHGYGTAPIPGSPAALEEMIRKYGSLSLKAILEPAIRLSREGFYFKKDYQESYNRYGEPLRLYRCPGLRSRRSRIHPPDGPGPVHR